MVNYSKWDNIDSDDDSDEQTDDLKLSSSGDCLDKLKLAKLRKLDADAVLNTINNRKIDDEVAKGFEDARALYLGSLSALGDFGLETKPMSSDKIDSWKEAIELRLSCHLNIAIGAIQGLQFDIALLHTESALSIQPDHCKALEFYAYTLLKLNRPSESVVAYSKAISILKSQDPNGDYSELTTFLKKAEIAEKDALLEGNQSINKQDKIQSNKKEQLSNKNIIKKQIGNTQVNNNNSQHKLQELRKELNYLMSQASSCSNKGDYHSAERFYQDGKRTCQSKGFEDYQGLAIISLQLSHIYILQADLASNNNNMKSTDVVKYDKKLLYAREEIDFGLKNVNKICKEAYNGIEWFNYKKDEMIKDRKVDFISRMMLVKARLLHRQFSIFERKSTNNSCNRGFATDRNQARSKAVACLKEAMVLMHAALQPWMMEGVNLDDDKTTNDNNVTTATTSTVNVTDTSTLVETESGDEVYEIDGEGNMVLEKDDSLKLLYGDLKLKPPPGWELLYIQLSMELGRMLLRQRTLDQDNEVNQIEEEDDDENTCKDTEGKSRRDKCVREAKHYLELGYHILYPMTSDDMSKDLITKDTRTKLEVDMLELLSEVYASEGNFLNAKEYSLRVHALLLEMLKYLHNSNQGIKPTKEYETICLDENDDEEEDGERMKLTENMKLILNKVKYGSTEQGRLELRISSLELSLGHILHQIYNQGIGNNSSSFQKKMDQNEEISLYFMHASKRLAKCGQPLKAAQVTRDIQRLYMNENELKGTSGGDDSSSNNNQNKESESEQQVRFSNMADHLLEASKLYNETLKLCQIMNNFKNKQVSLMSSDLFSSKFHRRIAMLVNWEVDCLDRCVSLLQHSCVDLCEVHAMLHVALTNVHRESQENKHLKQIAENKHQWALSSTRASRSKADASNNGEEKHHGADLAERLLLESEQEFYQLKEYSEAAGVCVARAILIKQRNRLVEALKLVERSVYLWKKHEIKHKVSSSNQGNDVKNTSSSLGPTPSPLNKKNESEKELKKESEKESDLELLHRAKKSNLHLKDNYDRVACELLLKEWTKEHERNVISQSPASTSSSTSSKSEDMISNKKDMNDESHCLKRRHIDQASDDKKDQSLNDKEQSRPMNHIDNHSMGKPSFMSYVARLFNALLNGENGMAWTVVLALFITICFVVFSRLALMFMRMSSTQSRTDI